MVKLRLTYEKQTIAYACTLEELNILYLEPKSMDAAFHFSVEEFAMLSLLKDEPVLMLWRTEPCAMLGRYQVADAEIDIALAEQKSIQVVRRSSGGGTIFTDQGTILYTVLLPYKEGDDVKQLQSEFVAGPVARALNDMGIPAKIEGRNDILLEGKKISGLAQYLSGDRLCSHGSLLYDADLELLARVLKPDAEKIKTKALQSVRSRVTNLVDYMKKPVSTQGFMTALKAKLFAAGDVHEYFLNEHDIAVIEKIRRDKYANPGWNFGKSPRFTFHNKKRYPLGQLEIFLTVEKGKITACQIYGDFLGLLPSSQLEQKLTLKPYQFQAIKEELQAVNLQNYLGGITLQQFLDCMFERNEESIN